MGLPGFFDLEERFAKLDGLGDPLAKLSGSVNWEGFRPALDAALSKPRKSNAGRREYDRVLMFRVLVLQQMYNLSDDQTEFQIRDRYSFARFLGLHPEDTVPDAKTIWRFRENLKLAEAFDSLFSELSSQIEGQGYVARRGQIVDASFVKAPRQRNSRDENAQVKAGKVPSEWSQKKRRHKDTDARWTRKRNETHYGYKNHISVDRAYRLVRRWEASDAACHDSKMFEQVLDETNTSGAVWADSAYSSRHHEAVAGRTRLAQPHSPQGASQPPLACALPGSQPQAFEGACGRRTCLCSTRSDGRQAGQDYRHGPGTLQDRHDEPGVQPAPACLAAGEPPAPLLRQGSIECRTRGAYVPCEPFQALQPLSGTVFPT